jgi:hypothetical protein
MKSRRETSLCAATSNSPAIASNLLNDLSYPCVRDDDGVPILRCALNESVRFPRPDALSQKAATTLYAMEQRFLRSA